MIGRFCYRTQRDAGQITQIQKTINTAKQVIGWGGK